MHIDVRVWRVDRFKWGFPQEFGRKLLTARHLVYLRPYLSVWSEMFSEWSGIASHFLKNIYLYIYKSERIFQWKLCENFWLSAFSQFKPLPSCQAFSHSLILHICILPQYKTEVVAISSVKLVAWVTASSRKESS